MRLRSGLAQCLLLVVTAHKTTGASHLPQHYLHEQGLRQQSPSTSIRAIDNFEASILNEPAKLAELFWLLTSNDGTRVPEKASSLDRNSRHGSIVLNNHGPDQPDFSHNSHHKDSGNTASLEISMSTIGGYPVYHTPIAVGTPPQPFRAWLNMGLNGLYVRSTACAKRDCGRGFTYDPSKSTSRIPSEHKFEVHPTDWTVGGEVSTDTLHLVSIDVDNATVGEIGRYEGEDLFYYVMEFVVDGALGLAPPNAQTPAYSPASAPNPLHALIQSHALKHNTLTLTLPNSVENRGSLQLGLPPQDYNNTIRIPFGNATTSGLNNTWHVPLSAVSLRGHGSHDKLDLSLGSVYGRLDLEPAIRLPPSITDMLYKTIGAKPGGLFHGASINCRAREKLPDLVLSVGGNDIMLTKDEYSSKQTVYGHQVCVVAILPSEGEDIAVLGTILLNKHHVIVDMDQKELRLDARAVVI